MRSHIFGERLTNKSADTLTPIAVGTDEQLLYANDLPCNLLETINNDANQCTYTRHVIIFD